MEKYISALKEISSESAGLTIAMLLAFLRMMHDKRGIKKTQILIEVLICGLISLTLSAAVKAAGMDEDWQIVGGGIVGLAGYSVIRVLALDFLKKKADKYNAGK